MKLYSFCNECGTAEKNVSRTYGLPHTDPADALTTNIPVAQMTDCRLDPGRVQCARCLLEDSDFFPVLTEYRLRGS